MTVFWRRFFGVPALAGVFLASAAAQTAPLTAEDVLQQFNAVVLGNMTLNQNIGGRTLVGGNVVGNGGSLYTQGNGSLAPSDYEALTVGGNVWGGWMHIQNGGNANIGANATNLNMNGHGTANVGGAYVGSFNQGTLNQYAAVSTPHFEGLLADYSSVLSGQVATSGITLTGNKATFDAVPGSNGTAVFSIADGADFFSSVGKASFDLHGIESVLINVGGTSAMDLVFNFLGGNMDSVLAPHLIWNFYEATDVDIQRQFYGTVLAPLASVTNGNNLHGTVVARNLTVNGQLRNVAFEGSFLQAGDDAVQLAASTVPEPAPLSLYLVGLLVIGGSAFHATRRRAYAKATA